MDTLLSTDRLTPYQQTMLATWQQHTYAEFVLKDADAALATMTENPYVLLVGSGVVRVGRAAVREFYANKFLPNIPPDFEITTVSQTFGDDRLVEEMAVRLPIRSIWIGSSRGYGLPAERPNSWSPVSSNSMTAKIAHEHAYWDQATVLSQLGVLDHPLAMGGVRSAAELLSLR